MADTLTVEIKGLDALQRKFSMSQPVVQREARGAMESSVVAVHNRSGRYPPAPPASSYVRTGTLGRLFAHRVETFSGGVRGIVSNTTPYAPYVKSDESQAWMHTGRWPTMKDDVMAEMGNIERYFAQAMENLAKFLGD